MAADRQVYDTSPLPFLPFVETKTGFGSCFSETVRYNGVYSIAVICSPLNMLLKH